MDISGIQPAPSKRNVIAQMSRPHTVEDLPSFLDPPGKQFLQKRSILIAPLSDILNK
ncbi:unnamed protein product [Sphacelaria rigidula]